jgi:eukaryotic-like serine/threonine-protein kinase
LMMEFLDGESLAARLRRGPMPLPTALRILDQCCSALAASHEKNIVHRDLKPENIYLCRRGDDVDFVKIVDFGIAKLMADPSASHTRAGMVLGTPQYMSPEQCEGKGRVDHRADIYSLGVVLFEVLTGRVPFDDLGVGDIIVAHLRRPAPRPSTLRPDLSPALDAVVLHAMEKDPARRFQSMTEFAAALAQQLPRAAPAAHAQSTDSRSRVLSGQGPRLSSTA